MSRKSDSRPRPQARARDAWLLGAFAAGAALLAAYADLLTVPFGNDDYLMLERTAHSGVLSWWGRANAFVGWWRPWSRETHYGWLQHAFGPDERAFHVASLALALATVGAYVHLSRRLAGAKPGAMAAGGALAMSAWAYPMLVVAGAQDLWMLLASTLALHLWASDRRVAASVAFAFALASKETACALPVLFVGHDLLLERRAPAEALRRAIAPLLLVIAWVAWHPHLGGGGFAHVGGAEVATGLAPSPAAVAARTLGVLASLDRAPAPAAGWPAVSGRALLVAACLIAALLLLARRGGGEASRARRGVIAFGILWAIAGWAPLFLPGLGWHAYYALLGALGAWLALGAALERLPLPACAALLAVLAALGVARADTLSHDWADASYVRRTSALLVPLRASLLAQVSAPPRASRFYFTGMPAESGFLSGDGPMLRVLYRDSTLTAGYLQSWRRRAAGAQGEDYFFAAAPGPSLRRLGGPLPSDAAGPEARTRWIADSRLLGETFFRAGDFARAGATFGSAADAFAIPQDADDAAECWQSAGNDSLAARYRAMARRTAR